MPCALAGMLGAELCAIASNGLKANAIPVPNAAFRKFLLVEYDLFG